MSRDQLAAAGGGRPGRHYSIRRTMHYRRTDGQTDDGPVYSIGLFVTRTPVGHLLITMGRPILFVTSPYDLIHYTHFRDIDHCSFTSRKGKVAGNGGFITAHRYGVAV